MEDFAPFTIEPVIGGYIVRSSRWANDDVLVQSTHVFGELNQALSFLKEEVMQYESREDTEGLASKLPKLPWSKKKPNV